MMVTWVLVLILTLSSAFLLGRFFFHHHQSAKGRAATAKLQTTFQDHTDHMASLDAVLVRYVVRQVSAQLEDPERLKATYGAFFVDADMRQKLQMIADVARAQLGTPMAAFTVVMKDYQRIVAASGIDSSGVAKINDSYCRFVVGLNEPFAVDDSQAHQLVCMSEATLNDDALRSYLGVPFVSPKGFVLGALCVADVVPRKWKVEHVEILTELCHLAVAADRDGVFA